MSNIIEFLRKKDYQFINELGQGACGKTVLLLDSFINEKFVCKKYSPFNEEYREELFLKFIQEIKLLHLIYHDNIVRIFNYYIYPEAFAGFILMEYINGNDIEQFLKKSPENINEIFLQTISGFKYLEERNILHRDIRPQNIMVRNDGVVKIIDFGFGKKIKFDEDFDKSISLNWWCELPEEFNEAIYNFKTEIYFIGKLFEKIIFENSIECFQYNDILLKMCQKSPENRITSFFQVNQMCLSDKFIEINFDEIEIKHYREFANSLFDVLPKIESGAKYYNDVDSVQKNIEDLYRKVMLEKYLPKNSLLIRCFINGSCYYNHKYFHVSDLKLFLLLLRSCPKEKKNIILSNLYTKLDSIERYDPDNPFADEDIPF